MAQDEKIDRRVKRTRQLLQQALIELLQEESFHSITVQDIAARAEVNRATFYAHFEDKYALLNYSVREKFQARLDARLLDKPGLTVENLRVLILTVCEYLGEFDGHCAPVPQFNEHALMFMQVQIHVHEIVLEWIVKSSESKQASDSATETVAMMVSWAIFGSVFQWTRAGRKLTPAALTEQVLAVLQTGLRDYLREEART